MEDQYELFDQYIAGELDAESSRQFEQALNQDEQLRKTFDTYRLGVRYTLWQKSANNQDNAFLSQLKKLRQETPAFNSSTEAKQSEDQLSKRLRLLLVIAAALIGLLLLVWALRSAFQTKATEEIILAEQYNPLPVPATLSPSTQDSMSAAFSSYRRKDFGKAIEIFTSFPKTDERFAEAQIFAAYAYFEQENYPAALEAYEQVIQSKDLRYISNAEWNQLLAALVLSSTNEKIEQYFQGILNQPTHSYNAATTRLYTLWKKEGRIRFK